MFADCTTHDVQPRIFDGLATNLYTGLGFYGLGALGVGHMSTMTIARHGSRPASAAPRVVIPGRGIPGMIDISFFDCHVEKSRLDNLWNYSWYAGWQMSTMNY